MNSYRTILADPPWQFNTYSPKGGGRGAISHYDTMSLDDLMSMNVAQFAADDCVLLVWAIDPMLPHALDLIKAWGFTYKTVGFYWAKSIAAKVAGDIWNDSYWPIGTGYWTRANPEQCLLATRGHPKRLNADVRKLIVAPRREHSRKPDEIYPAIERLCPGPYLELFARSHRDGWDVIGNEVDLFAKNDHAPTRRRHSNSKMQALLEEDLTAL